VGRRRHRRTAAASIPDVRRRRPNRRCRAALRGLSASVAPYPALQLIDGAQRDDRAASLPPPSLNPPPDTANAMKDVAVVWYCRTGIARAKRGALNATHGIPLTARVLRHAVGRAGIEAGEIDDAVLGCGLPEGVTAPRAPTRREIAPPLQPCLRLIPTTGARYVREGSGNEASLAS
jgi:hypothetical protein